MKLVKLDPPGSWCQNEAIFEMVDRLGSKTFLEIGCGAGDLSKKLCQRGMTGIGLDFSSAAIKLAQENLAEFIQAGKYKLIQSDLEALADSNLKVDLGISIMVMEHVQDDIGFLKNITRFVRPGGQVIIGVPGRRDCWSFEDDTAGHLRRYDRQDLAETLSKAGLKEIDVWSISVPLSNWLWGLSNFLTRHSAEREKIGQSQREQTETSGIREIPFKTVYPAIFKLVLNRFTMYPLHVVQRLFYRTNLGLTILGTGKVPQ